MMPQLRIMSRVRPGCLGMMVPRVSFFRPIAARCGSPRMASKVTPQWRPGSVLPQRRGITTPPNLSYAEGPTEPPLLEQTIPEHFASIVAQHGDQPAVIARSPTPINASLTSSIIPPTTTLTYASLDALSNALARSLRDGLGVRKGDRVAVSLANVAEHVILAYAVFKLGAILVPLNPGFTAPQLAAALHHLEVRVLVIAAVADAAYRPCRGRSNLGLLQALLPDLEDTAGRVVGAPAVPSLKSAVVLDNRGDHPDVVFPLERLRSLVPFEELLPKSLYPPSSPHSPSSSSSSHISSPSTRPITPDAPLSPSETINIQFTSGTTSRPKAAQLTHRGILNNGFLIAQRMGLVPATDRVVCPPPLFHCFGSVLGLMATATTGAALLLPSPAFDPAASLRMAAEHRATGLYGVATMFVAELDLLASNATFQGILNDTYESSVPSGCGGAGEGGTGLASHLRKGIAAGSSVPEALMRRLFETLGLRDLVICYGMTETSPVSAMTAPADPFAKRTETVGRAMPHTALKVVTPPDHNDGNDEKRNIVARGERGELAVSGYLVMRGYWGDEAQTREVLVADEHHDGGERGGWGRGEGVWMYTGDEARMDEEGYVEITGRIKDLIIRGGENVHPLEIENCLLQHPFVRDASVVGVPDARYGEVVGVFVVPAHGVVAIADGDGALLLQDENEGKKGKVLSKDALRDWVSSHLSNHLVPKYVFWIDEYPKTASGKIQKFKLRDMAKELIAGGPQTGGAAAP